MEHFQCVFMVTGNMEEEHLRDLASEAAGSVNDATVMEDNTHTHTC